MLLAAESPTHPDEGQGVSQSSPKQVANAAQSAVWDRAGACLAQSFSQTEHAWPDVLFVAVVEPVLVGGSLEGTHQEILYQKRLHPQIHEFPSFRGLGVCTSA